MKNQIQLANSVGLVAHSCPLFRLTFFTLLGCFLTVSSVARAVTPPPDGDYRDQNTAESEGARFSVTTGANVTAMRFDALYSNTTGSDNALANWIWRATGSLNTARESH